MRYCDQEGSRTQKIWFSQFALIVAEARIAISVVYPLGLAIFTEYYCARSGPARCVCQVIVYEGLWSNGVRHGRGTVFGTGWRFTGMSTGRDLELDDIY